MKKINKCRICDSKDIKKVIDLGNQYLTGSFPKSIKEKITKGPLKLFLCKDCSLLQLSHSYDLNQMYGENYGYRSGLNKSMISHLKKKSYKLKKYINNKDIILDIGSNDGTLLNHYNKKNIKKIGIDPTIEKFKKFYKKNTILINDFFSYRIFNRYVSKKAKLITSIAMFYDLESPIKFANDIQKVLDEKGIWHFEQSYMPTMLKNNSYDTICHEHIEYYSLNVILNILNKVGMKILDCEINDINGGSIAITAVKKNNPNKTQNIRLINNLLKKEKKMKFDKIIAYKIFDKKIKKSRERIIKLLNTFKNNNKLVLGYGASTKGNVILQYCNINKKLIPFIAEVNKDKFNKFTPGTKIKIISEKKAKLLKPDYFFVLPWHFKKMIIRKEIDYIKSGGKLIFPLPEIQIVNKKNYKKHIFR